jgi:hypothetical protein
MFFTEKFSLGFSIWSVGDTGGQWNWRAKTLLKLFLQIEKKNVTLQP